MIHTTCGRAHDVWVAVLAEFERELIRERTKTGMRAAKERGALICRPRKLSVRQIGGRSV